MTNTVPPSTPQPTPQRGLGPLGTRLLVAFIVVALSSVVVLSVAALIGIGVGLTQNQNAERNRAVNEAVTAATQAYQATGDWTTADLSQVDAIAAAAGARVAVFDANGTVVLAPSGSMMGPGSGMGMGMGSGTNSGVRSAAIIVDGQQVGTIRLGFGSPTTTSAEHIAWAWILVAAVVALISAIIVAYFVTRRIAAPLNRLTGVARTFAAGDRTVRPKPDDLAEPGELGELARAFSDTADSVVRSESARRQLAADVAHELRTPLTALQAGLEEMRDGLMPADAETLTALHTQTLRLARVVDDLAELSSAEAAVFSMRRDLVDLSVVTSESVTASRAALAVAGVQVSTDIEPGVVVLGDSDRLHQALGNVLSNVARYCTVGDAVSVQLSASDTHAVLRISDTGPGIAPGDQEHVFERLWRGRSDTSGSGIGLAVVREIVDAHGGTVTVESVPNEGATFVVTLPLGSNNS